MKTGEDEDEVAIKRTRKQPRSLEARIEENGGNRGTKKGMAGDEKPIIPENLELLTKWEWWRIARCSDAKEGETEIYTNEGMRITIVVKKWEWTLIPIVGSRTRRSPTFCSASMRPLRHRLPTSFSTSLLSI